MACVVVCKEGAASDWGDSFSNWLDLKASLMQQIQYSDNMVLNPTQPKAAFGYILNPSLEANHQTESSFITLKAQGNIKRYDNSLFNCENYGVTLNSQYKTQRSVFKLTGTYGNACAYSQQAQETGVIIPGVQSTTYNIDPSWTWQWTPRDQLSLDAMYRSMSYSGGGSSGSANLTKNGSSPNGYTNFDTYTINLGLNHVWDRYVTLTGGVYFMNSQYMGTNPSTQQSLGFQLGGNYLINQQWSANFSAGLRRTEIQSNSLLSSSASNTSSMSPLGNFSVNYKGSLSTFSAVYSNTIMPSALGQTLQLQSITTKYSYQIYQHLSFDINTILLDSQPIGGQSTKGSTTTSNSREAFTNIMEFVWEFSRNWQLKGSYMYRWQKYQQQNPAESNTIMLSVSYSLDDIQDTDTSRYNLFDNRSSYGGTIEKLGQWF